MHEPGESKRMEGLQPAVVCMTPLVAATRDDSDALVRIHCHGY